MRHSKQYTRKLYSLTMLLVKFNNKLLVRTPTISVYIWTYITYTLRQTYGNLSDDFECLVSHHIALYRIAKLWPLHGVFFLLVLFYLKHKLAHTTQFLRITRYFTVVQYFIFVSFLFVNESQWVSCQLLCTCTHLIWLKKYSNTTILTVAHLKIFQWWYSSQVCSAHSTIFYNSYILPQ